MSTLPATPPGASAPSAPPSPPQRRLRRVCVYCGSSNHIDERYRAAARAMAGALLQRGIDLVFGGGRVGLMGELADAMLAGGGRVYGVIPQKLMAHELGHLGCTELFVVEGMHARKMMMGQLADAFVALPGGFGTLEELFEVTTWTQLRFHDKPVGVLNTDGFYDLLLAFIQQAHHQGFIRDLHKDLIHSETDPGRLLDTLARAELPSLEQWITKV